MKLADVLAPLSVAEFLETHYGQRPLFGNGSPTRFETLMADARSAALARQLEYELEAPVTVEPARWASPPAPARRDTLVLQLTGETRWRVGTADSGNPCLEALAGAGDVLYIPRGLQAAADPTDDSSLRLEFVIGNPTGIELLEWIAELLRREECFQRDIPRFAGPAVQAQWQEAIGNAVATLFRPPGLAQRFTRSINESLPPHGPSGLPWRQDLSEDHLVAMAARRPWRLRRAVEGAVYLVSDGRPLVLDEAAVPLLDFLARNTPFPLSAFYGAFASEFDREEIAGFLEVMAANGMISIHEPGAVL